MNESRFLINYSYYLKNNIFSDIFSTNIFFSCFACCNYSNVEAIKSISIYIYIYININVCIYIYIYQIFPKKFRSLNNKNVNTYHVLNNN